MIRLLTPLSMLVLAMAAGCAPRVASFGLAKPAETFRVGRATYSIPRAYLYPSGGAASPRLSVTLPGMSPTKLSSLCQGPLALRGQLGCKELIFLLEPSPYATIWSTISNLRRDGFELASAKDEYGYTVYWPKKEPDLTVFVFSESRGFTCSKRYGTCLDIAAISNGVAAHFLIPYNRRSEIPSLEKKIDTLMTSLTVKS
jgi:hypothetical protein